MTQHPQADILRAIADGKQAQTYAEHNEWFDITPSYALVSLTRGDPVRIKPATITINGCELPRPVPPFEAGQFHINLSTDNADVDRCFWWDSSKDRDAVYNKIVEVLGS